MSAAAVGDIQYTLTNNLPYAVAVENGSSKQAPSGMVKTSVRGMASSIEKAGKKEGKRKS